MLLNGPSNSESGNLEMRAGREPEPETVTTRSYIDLYLRPSMSQSLLIRRVIALYRHCAQHRDIFSH